MTLKKRIFLRIFHEFQLEHAPEECRRQYEKEQRQWLERSVQILSAAFAVVWTFSFSTDYASGAISQNLYVRSYFLSFLLILFLSSTHKSFKARTNNFKKLVIFSSFLQFCVIQGLTDQYMQTNSIPFVVLASAVATIATRANAWEMMIYFLLSNGAYLAFSQYISKITSQVDVDFLQFSLVCHVFLLAVPAVYFYDQSKARVELHKRDFAIKQLQELL